MPPRCRRVVPLWHESDERGPPESRRRPPAQHSLCNDPQPLRRTPDGLCHYRPYPEFVGIDSDGCQLCQRRPYVACPVFVPAQSMAVIFGANVGTTFTAWIIALFGFKVSISAFVLPIIGLAVVLLLMNKSKTKNIGEFLIGFSFLFMGLDMISAYVPDLQSNPEMFAYLRQYASMGLRSVLIFCLVGVVLTMIIQSSAATFAIVLIMCSKGWITFDLACALVLGSNIGTTVTPYWCRLQRMADRGHWPGRPRRSL